MSNASPSRPASVSTLWVALLIAFAVVETMFLFGAYTSGIAGQEKIFGIFAGLVSATFGIILYAGRLIFYD